MTNGNEPAFSKAAFYHPHWREDSSQEGLTKREYFTAMALQGLLANSHWHKSYYEYANDAAHLADDLIEALNRKT